MLEGLSMALLTSPQKARLQSQKLNLQPRPFQNFRLFNNIVNEIWLLTMAKKQAKIILEISILLLSSDTWVRFWINLFI